MFNTTVIDVVIGLVFVYLLLSLMCSAANEMIEGWLKNRAADLERGLRELLKDPQGNGLVKKVYDHPLISGLFEGTYDPQEVGKLKRALGKLKLPSYIPARTFALVLLDTALPAKPDAAGGTATSTPSAMTTEAESRDAFAKLRNNISGLDNPEVEKALLSLVDAADNDVAKARENIEKWFDASMDRVSGWYKRRSQVFVFVIGIFLTIGVNADSVLIARRLSADKVMRESLVSAAQSFAKVDAEETAKNAASAKASPSPNESSAKPKPSPSPASSPSPGGASTALGASPTPKASVSPTPNTSPTASPTPSPATATTTEKDKPDCNTPQCRYRDSLTELQSLSLPIGWASGVEGQPWPGLHFWEGAFWVNWATQFRVHIFGWLLTALAISLGAPFWFDLLNKFIVVRATVKPQEKSPEEKSKD